jgi:hypothetical protein
LILILTSRLADRTSRLPYDDDDEDDDAVDHDISVRICVCISYYGTAIIVALT